MSDRPDRPFAWQVEPQCPEWTLISVDRLEMKEQDAIEDNQKRLRGGLDEDTGAEGAAEESLPPPGAESSGDVEFELARLSRPLDVGRPEDMDMFRHATLTPASFAPARHLFMCCGRPIVVHLLLTFPPPPQFLIATGFGALKIGSIRLICFELFSGASCFFLFSVPCILQSLPPDFVIRLYTLLPWGLVALHTHVSVGSRHES